MTPPYDAIVVGARCAGSPTAMLLARKGYRVLAVDRATFPSDTVSSHIVQPLAVALLADWGLLDRLVATGCPPIHTYAYDFDPIHISGSPGTNESPVSYCARRTVLDTLLVAAAREAGVEVREGFAVEELTFDDGRVTGLRGHSRGGDSVTERARVVVGADGWHSLVAQAVKPERYRETPPLVAAYYSYWSGLPMAGRLEVYMRGTRGFGAAPTHEGLTMIIGGWPQSEFAVNKQDVERHFQRMLELVPSFSERLRGAKREARFAGASLPNYFHKPYGPGWVLVGDAGYVKDSITAQGINDAFHDAERSTTAIDQWLCGARSFDEAMAGYQRARDEHALPMFEFTCQLARMEPPSADMQRLFGAIAGNARAMHGFAQVNAGTISPALFFSRENIGAIMAGSGVK